MIVHLFGRAHCFLFRSLSRLHFNFNHYMLSPRAGQQTLPEYPEDKDVMENAPRPLRGQNIERAKTWSCLQSHRDSERNDRDHSPSQLRARQDGF